jgi:IS5 family transposase
VNKSIKTLHSELPMYRKTENQLTLENFHLPFGGELDPDNRWIKLSNIIPWDQFETKYAAKFAKSNIGAPAKPVRMALGALILKERCGCSDEELVEQVKENPYMQYFIGLPGFQKKAPFDPSMMVYFRKRFDAKTLLEINEIICGVKPKEDSNDSDQGKTPPDPSGKNNKGILIVDATCAPADIRYPTDCSLLNEAREKLEAMIDNLYEPFKQEMVKPRTYRKKARKDFLNFTKSKRPKPNAIRRANGKQLQYVRRDLKTIDKLLSKNPNGLSDKQRNELEVIQKLYRQQKEMYDTKTHRVEDRIVSISQPYVRPIVRGKVTADTEFGAKVAVSLVNGYAFVDKLSWDNFHEGVELKDCIEKYYQRFSFYPKIIAADKLYRNHDNFQICKQHGIHLSGPKLGRPPKQPDKKQRQLERFYEKIRNAIEGKFGEGKRCYGLGRIMARLKETSESVIMLQFLVMNVERRLRVLLSRFFKVQFFIDPNKVFRINWIIVEL